MQGPQKQRDLRKMSNILLYPNRIISCMVYVMVTIIVVYVAPAFYVYLFTVLHDNTFKLHCAT